MTEALHCPMFWVFVTVVISVAVGGYCFGGKS